MTGRFRFLPQGVRQRWPCAVMALLVAGLAGACSSPATDPTGPSPGPVGGVASPATVTTSPVRSAPAFDARSLALCTRIDLRPLAGLSVKVQSSDDKAPPSAPGSACLFELVAGGGRSASLRVEAATPASVEQAKLLYATTRDVTVMRPDGVVAGIGEEAEGFVRTSGSGRKTSEYMVRARSGNLVIKVWLAVTGTAATPKSTLAPPVRAIASATLALVPTI